MKRVLRENRPAAGHRGRVVVWGLLAHSPFGGMTWQVLHHLVGLRRLGFDVWYVEDSDRYLLDLRGDRVTREYEANVAFMAGQLETIGMGDRWIFRPPCQNDVALGARHITGLHQLYREADAVLNLCGAQELLPAHDIISCLVYLETDPVASQVGVASGDTEWIAELRRYHHLFTYGTNLGAADCLVPMKEFTWHPTVPPVVTDWWVTDEPPARDAALTSVVSWSNSGKDIDWQGRPWRWTKEFSFEPYLNLPASSALPLELALRGESDEARAELLNRGWRVRPAAELDDPSEYRSYIRQSLGEFSVAKEQYVLPRSGWFSDRTVCYLAAGHPAIVEDTGFKTAAGRGRGLHMFSDPTDALEAIKTVATDHERESAAAQEIAREEFEAERVLGRVMQQIGLL